MTNTEAVAWLYENEEGSKELILDCNSEYARRLLEFGYTETPLAALSPTAKTEPSATGLVRGPIAIARALDATGLLGSSDEMDVKEFEAELARQGFQVTALSAPTRERELLREVRKYLWSDSELITRIDNLLNEGSGQ